VRHLVRLPGQLVRRVLGQSSRGGVGRLCRQPADGFHGLLGRAARVGAPRGRSRHDLLECADAGVPRGHLDRVPDRVARRAGLLRGRRADRRAGGYAAASQVGMWWRTRYVGRARRPVVARSRALTRCALGYDRVMRSVVLPTLAMASLLCACASLHAPDSTTPQPPEAGGGIPPGEPLPPGQPVPPEQPSRPSQRQFHLGAAATALVTQAHAQATGGNYGLAAATLERALRIEPDNPLLWIELGQVRLSEGNPSQAD